MSRERGSATVWLLAFSLLGWLAAVAVLGYGSAVTARHRAATAADLAALAGAAAAADIPPAGPSTAAPCQAATSVAAANGARLLDCGVDGFTVAVIAAVPLPWLAQLARAGTAGWAHASARAGPA